jgi:hypothetical protein
LSRTSAAPYRFANLLWADKLRDSKSRWKTVINVAAYALVPWLFGLLISLHADRLGNYLRTPAFYLGCVGIMLTLLALMYGSKKHFDIYGEVLECFDLSNEARTDIVHNILDKYYNSFRHLLSAFLVLLVGIILSVLGFWYWEDVRFISDALHTELPRFAVFAAHGWYDPKISSHGLAIVVMFAFFIALPLGTSTSLMLRMPFTLWRLASQRSLLPPLLIKSYFSGITSLYSVVSISWLVGALMMLYLFGSNDDPISYAFALGFLILGLLTFTLPQIVYIKVISDSEDRYFEIIRLRLFTSDHNAEQQTSDFPKILDLGTLTQLMSHDQWVYPLHQTYFVVGAYALSAISYVSIPELISKVTS